MDGETKMLGTILVRREICEGVSPMPRIWEKRGLRVLST
jgi:hypothetical protein